MRSRSRLLTSVLLFSGMALLGSATPLSKIVAGQFPVFTASLLRVAIAAVAVSPFVAGRLSGIGGLTRRDWLLVAAIAVMGMFGFTVLLLFGMRLVSGVVGAIIMSTAPAVTAAAAVLFRDETWNRRKAAAVGLAVAGIVVVNLDGSLGLARDGSGTGALLLGSLLVFGAVCCEAGYTLIGKAASERTDPVLVVFLACILSLPLFLAAVLALELGSFASGEVDVRGWTMLIAWGAGALGLGSVLWYRGVRRAEGSVAAGFMGVMPVSALGLSYVLLGEPVRVLHLVGFAVVFTGVVLMSREHARGGGESHHGGGEPVRGDGRS